MIAIKNKKGFTLVEMLAVIVIIGVLITMAVPTITNYINESRQKVFAENAVRAMRAVKEHELKEEYLTGSTSNITPECTNSLCHYNIQQINALLGKKLDMSPFGAYYSDASEVITQNTTDSNKKQKIYKMCLIDKGNNGFGYLESDQISAPSVRVGTIRNCDGSLFAAINICCGDGCEDPKEDVCKQVGCKDAQCMIDYFADNLR